MGASLQPRLLTPRLLALAGLLATWMAVALLACSGPSTPRDSSNAPATDPTRQPAYLSAIESLANLNAEAQAHFDAGHRKQAAALVTEGDPLSKELLSVSRPNLAAMEAVSDRDQLYGDLLLSNRHAAHARQLYQRNVARWKHWQPQTENTLRRLQEAESAIARCDLAMDIETRSPSASER